MPEIEQKQITHRNGRPLEDHIKHEIESGLGSEVLAILYRISKVFRPKGRDLQGPGNTCLCMDV